MIAEIENAMVDRLQSASDLGLLGYRFKTVESYADQLDTPAGLTALVPKMPAALVVFLGADQPKEMGNGTWQYPATFSVLLAAHNKRNQAAARHGHGDAEVGTYQMVRDVLRLLSGQRLGLKIGRLVPGKVRQFPTAKTPNLSASIVAVEFDTTWTEYEAPELTTAAIPAGAVTTPGAAGLLPALNRAAGITDFNLAHVDWTTPIPAATDVNLET